MMRRLLLLLLIIVANVEMHAFSWSLDSIAEMGRFPNFCVKAYRWADWAFNHVDSNYVKPTGYKMNVKVRSQSWAEYNSFFFGLNERIGMRSEFTTSLGADLTYLAVSVGYSFNCNKIFDDTEKSAKRFNFDFTSARISGRFYAVSNDGGMIITQVGKVKKQDIPFDDVKTSTWGLEGTYFFNHERYSNGAALSFSKLQQRSQGSFTLGMAYQRQKLRFDFRALPEEVKMQLPEEEQNMVFASDGNIIGISGGYGYNWVPLRRLTVGVSTSLIPSLHYGYLNDTQKDCSFRMNYRLNLSAVINNGRWFYGVVFRADAGNIFTGSTVLSNSVLTIEAKAGWRFNLW